MRYNKTQTISEVLKDYIKTMNLGQKLKEAEVLKKWDDLVGKNISKTVNDIYIKNKVLYVHIRSSVVKYELSLLKDQLVRRINEEFNEKIIDSVVLR